MGFLYGYIHKRVYDGLNHRLRRVARGRLAGFCRPTSISLLLTERCNARCLHCDIWKNRGREDSPSAEDWMQLLSELRAWLGPVQVTVTGGEALLVPRTPEIVAHGARTGLLMEVLTHGYWKDQSRIEALARARPWRITMSLDGLGEVHSLVRGREGFFGYSEASLDNLIRLREAERLPYRLRLKTVVMHHNIDELVPLTRFATQEGMDIFFQPIEQNYNTAEDPDWFLTSENWPKDPSAAVAAVTELIRLRAAGAHIANSPAQLEAMIRYFKDPAGLRVATQAHAAHEDHLTCSALDLVQIQSNGDVTVCLSRPPVGNIKHHPIREVWESRPQWWRTGCCLGTRLAAGVDPAGDVEAGTPV